jgi:hypothetical protein
MKPEREITAVCANCRFLEEYPHADERTRQRAWCRIWRLLIPDPEHMGCTLFQAKEGRAQEGPAEE